MTARSFIHALLAEYIPFIVLLTALFTVAGGIHIRGNLHSSPALNTAILAISAVLARFMGTTGALTPLGDPPLFLGFLKGVDFFWTVHHIFAKTLFLIGSLLVIFYALDIWLFRRRVSALTV